LLSHCSRHSSLSLMRVDDTGFNDRAPAGSGHTLTPPPPPPLQQGPSWQRESSPVSDTHCRYPRLRYPGPDEHYSRRHRDYEPITAPHHLPVTGHIDHIQPTAFLPGWAPDRRRGAGIHHCSDRATEYTGYWRESTPESLPTPEHRSEQLWQHPVSPVSTSHSHYYFSNPNYYTYYHTASYNPASL